MTDTTDDNSLTSVEYWQEDFWQIGEQQVPQLDIDPGSLEYRELHQFFNTHLPAEPNLTLLELGCHPGRWMHYFHKQFGYDVEGVEYVPPACELTRQALAAHDVPATIHQADVFDFQPDQLYDIVISLGLVEHFHDVGPMVQRHADLTKPGGLVAIEIPNHAGINGWIVKRIDRKLYDAHNHMWYKQLKQAIDQNPQLEFVAGGYLSRFNLSPSNLFPLLLKKWPLWLYKFVFRVYRVALIATRILPNTRWFSPNTAIIARRVDPASDDENV